MVKVPKSDTNDVPVSATVLEDDTLAVPVLVNKEGVAADVECMDVDLRTEANEMPEYFVAHAHIQASQVTVHPTVHPVHKVTLLQRMWNTLFAARVQVKHCSP